VLVSNGQDKSLLGRENEPSSVVHSLPEDQLLAIIIYTLGHAPYPPVYRFFNSDSRKGIAGVAGNDFPILFQLLEDGGRTLLKKYKQDSHNEDELEKLKYPFKTYRGVGVRFKANIGDKVRFGQFCSTTANKSISEEFIAQEGPGGTLFTIFTKLGAPIWELSEFPREKEVLIPPCEAFRVADCTDNGKFITLESLVPSEKMVDEYIADVEVACTIANL